MAGHSSLFRFPSGDIMCGIPERNLSQHPMGYDPILSGMISCGLYAKPFAVGIFLKALVTKERSEQILLITEFTGRGLLPEDASSLSVVHWRISCLVRWRSNIGDWILRSEPFASWILSALYVSDSFFTCDFFSYRCSFFFKERSFLEKRFRTWEVLAFQPILSDLFRKHRPLRSGFTFLSSNLFETLGS